MPNSAETGTHPEGESGGRYNYLRQKKDGLPSLPPFIARRSGEDVPDPEPLSPTNSPSAEVPEFMVPRFGGSSPSHDRTPLDPAAGPGFLENRSIDPVPRPASPGESTSDLGLRWSLPKADGESVPPEPPKRQGKINTVIDSVTDRLRGLRGGPSRRQQEMQRKAAERYHATRRVVPPTELEALRDPVRREEGLANLRRMRGEKAEVTPTPEQTEKMKREVLADNNKRLTRFLFEFARYSQEHSNSDNRFADWLSGAHAEGRWENVHNVSQLADMMIDARFQAEILDNSNYGLSMRGILPEADFNQLVDELWFKINDQDLVPPVIAGAEQVRRLGFQTDERTSDTIAFIPNEQDQNWFNHLKEYVERLEGEAEKNRTPEEIEAIRDRIRDEYNAEAARRIEAVIVTAQAYRENNDSLAQIDDWKWLENSKLPGPLGLPLNDTHLVNLLLTGSVTPNQLKRLAIVLGPGMATEYFLKELQGPLERQIADDRAGQPRTIDAVNFLTISQIRKLGIEPINIQDTEFNLPQEFDDIKEEKDPNKDIQRKIGLLDIVNEQIRRTGIPNLPIIYRDISTREGQKAVSEPSGVDIQAVLKTVTQVFKEYGKTHPDIWREFASGNRSIYREVISGNLERLGRDGYMKPDDAIKHDIVSTFPNLMITSNIGPDDLESVVKDLRYIFTKEECKMILENFFRMKGVTS
jgi:hypothetical protein